MSSVFRPPFWNRRRRPYVPASTAAGASQPLVMPFVSSTASISAPVMAHRGPIRIESVTTGTLEGVSSISFPYTVSDAATGCVLLFMMGEDFDLTSPYVTADSDDFFEYSAAKVSVHVFGGLDLAGNINFTTEIPVTLPWILVTLTGVNNRLINILDVTGGVAESVNVSETFNTNGLVMAAVGYDTANFDSSSDIAGNIELARVEDTAENGLILVTRPIPDPGAASYTVGHDITFSSPPDWITTVAVLLRGYAPYIELPTIATTTTLYAPDSVELEGQTLNLPTIASTATFYAPTVENNNPLLLPAWDVSTTFYAPTVTGEPGAAQIILLPFMGNGQPIAINAPFIASTAEVYAIEQADMVIYMTATIESALTVYGPSSISTVRSMTGTVYTPVSVAN
jgi:hypothetical protein